MQGYESWVRIFGNNNWTANATPYFGYYMDCEAEAFNQGQEINERDSRVVFGRNSKPSSRSYGNIGANGNITIYPRTDDIVPILKSHFQCWQFNGTLIYNGSDTNGVGGTLATGTGTFIFVPTPNRPGFGGGNAWGTYIGSVYSGATKGDVYTSKVDVKWGDSITGSNAIAYFMGVVDQLEFTCDAGDDLKMMPTYQFGSVDMLVTYSAAHNPSSAYGSYSTKSRLIAKTGTLTYTYAGVGTTQDITNVRITSQGNIAPIFRIGQGAPSKYSFGRNLVNGEFTLEWADSAFLREFKQDGSAALTLEFKNANNDHLKIDLPLIKFAPFQPNVAAGDAAVNTTIPFRAYMSEDGGTPAITVTLYSIWRQHGTIN